MSMAVAECGSGKTFAPPTLRKIAATFWAIGSAFAPLWRWADSVRALSGHSGDHLFDD